MELTFLAVNAIGSVRRATLHGRQFYVAPLTLIVPGVLNGSRGPLLYPAEQCAVEPARWNGMPLTKGHPKQDKDGVSNYVSARQPDILEKVGVGYVYEAKFNGKLQAQGWFDIENCRKVDKRIIENLEQGKPIELSTGLFLDTHKAAENASHNGKPYVAVTSNYKPDHVAVLLDGQGACSLKDGCGVNVNSEPEHTVRTTEQIQPVPLAFGSLEDVNGKLRLVPNQLSHDDIRASLGETIRQRWGMNAYVSDVYDKNVVFWSGDKYLRTGYTTDLRSGTIELSTDSPAEVSREVSWVSANYDAAAEQSSPAKETKSGNDPNCEHKDKKGNCMPKTAEERKKIVDNLISNCDCGGEKLYSEDDRTALNAKTDEQLDAATARAQKFIENAALAKAAREGHSDNAGGSHVYNAATKQWDHKPKAPEPQQQTTNTQHPAKPTTEAEYLAAAPESIRNRFALLGELEQAERDKCITKLTGNLSAEAKAQSVAIYNTLPLTQLKALAAGIPDPKPAQQNGQSFLGANGAPVFSLNAADEDKDDVLSIPTLNYAEIAAEQRQNDFARKQKTA